MKNGPKLNVYAGFQKGLNDKLTVTSKYRSIAGAWCARGNLSWYCTRWH